MAQEYASIEVRRERGKLRIIGFGRTAKGQRYIKKDVAIDASSIAAPDFKSEMADAVKKLAAGTV